ncbi:radical SAM protein [archaeon]|nr:radical SAM protein [archaeon]
MQKEKTFLYQINVTRDCNLRCTHCYIHSDIKAASKTMIGEQVISIAHGIVEHMKKINYKRAEIHFVGGEPTMLGLAFFKENILKFKEIVKNAGFDAEVMMISNLLHEDIVEIAKFFDRVTTSYEVNSRFVSLKGVYKPKLEQKWLENVKKLQAVGIDLGVTTAITKPVVDFGAGKLLSYFYENGIKQIHFGFFIPEGDGLINMKSIMPEFNETSDFLIDSAKWYLERRELDKNLWVNPFESMLSAIDSNEPLDDIVCPIISGSLDINWDGNSATCLESGGSNTPEWSGNIFETSISTVAASAHFMKKVLDAAKPQKICRTCEEYPICKSGCGVLFKFFDPILDTECPGFKKFIKFVKVQNEAGLKPRYTKYLGKSC